MPVMAAPPKVFTHPAVFSLCSFCFLFSLFVAFLPQSLPNFSASPVASQSFTLSSLAYVHSFTLYLLKALEGPGAILVSGMHSKKDTVTALMESTF